MKHIRWLLIAVAFLTLCLGGFHGYSISAWQNPLHHGEVRVDWIGHAQGIRSDDYLAGIPLALSQTHNRFGSSSEILFGGQNLMVNSYSPPIAHWVGVFKPETWGYFVSPDFGLAWSWWMNTLLLILGGTLMLGALTRLEAVSAALLAAGFYFSPFVQMWSLIPAPYLGGFFLAVYFFLLLVRESGPGTRRAAWALGFLYFSMDFILHLYPGFQIPLGIVAVALGVAALRTRTRERPWTRGEVVTLIVPLVVIGVLVAAYLWEAREAISTLANTVYPGARRLEGGGHDWHRIFRQTFLHLQRSSSRLGPNICEAAGFLIWSPFALAGVALTVRRRGARFLPETRILIGVLLAVFALYYLWEVASLPVWLAKLTLLNRVQENRVLIGMGVLDLALIAVGLREIARSSEERSVTASTRGIWLIGAGTALASLLALLVWHPNLRGVEWGSSAILAALLGFAMAALARGRPRQFALMFLFANLYQTAGFNPLARGGYGNLFLQAEISREMMEVAATRPGAGWIVSDTFSLIELPRALGLKSYSGVQFIPNFEFWRILDPAGEQAAAYNRYAHVYYLCSPRPGELSITSPQEDVVQISVDPAHENFQRLPFEFVLLEGTKARDCFEKSGLYERIREIAPDRAIYRRIPK